MEYRWLKLGCSITLTILLLVLLAYFIAFAAGYTHQHTLYGWFQEILRWLRGAS